MFEHQRFWPTVEQMMQAGMRIASIQELQATDTAWLRKWWQLTWAVVPDMPIPEAFTPETLDELRAGSASPQIRLDAVFVATDTATRQ